MAACHISAGTAVRPVRGFVLGGVGTLGVMTVHSAVVLFHSLADILNGVIDGSLQLGRGSFPVIVVSLSQLTINRFVHEALEAGLNLKIGVFEDAEASNTSLSVLE